MDADRLIYPVVNGEPSKVNGALQWSDGEAYYGPVDLAGLPGMPGTIRGVHKCAIREEWASRERIGRGGGREYPESALPAVTRAALRGRREAALAAELSVVTPVPVVVEPVEPVTEGDLRAWQRLERDARLGVCGSVRRWMAEGLSVAQAYEAVLGEALAAGPGSLEQRQLQQATDARGQRSVGFPSLRSVRRWLAAGDAEALAPRTRRRAAVPGWAGDFLACYQVPQKPSVAQAYGVFVGNAVGAVPSIHQVRRWLESLPVVAREKGRMGPRALKDVRPFVRRTFGELWPNDVWSADGHTFDAEVQHPIHGQPFRPEITTIVDIGTRAIVGWSVGLAESSLCTVDALRHGVLSHGVPAIFYVDNGSGYANELLEDAATGLLSRLGITVKHSLPYNSQARGVIERLHRSVWVAAAKLLPSYLGADMDGEARQANFRATRRGNAAGVVALPLSWPGFVRLCEDAIAAYNARPHGSLPKVVMDGKRVHLSPEGFWARQAASLAGFEPVWVAEADAETLFRPRVARKVLRGEISLFGNRYFSGVLEGWHGESVQVGYDIHDAQRVWVYGGAGEFIGVAEWNGNGAEYFPKPVVEQARERRGAGRLQRLERQAEEIRQERDGGAALEAVPVSELPGMRQAARVVATVSERAPVIPEEGRERYVFWRDWQAAAARGEAVPESLGLFLRSFPNTALWRTWHAHFSGELSRASGP